MTTDAEQAPSAGRKRHPFGDALQRRDPEAAIALLAPDVTLYSPVSSEPFRGRDVVGWLLRALLDVELELLELLDEIREGNRIALRFRVRIGSQDVDVVDYLTLDEQERVLEYRVLCRPLAGAAGYLAAMGPRVARRRGRFAAAITATLIRPLPTILARSDALASRLLLAPLPGHDPATNTRNRR